MEQHLSKKIVGFLLVAGLVSSAACNIAEGRESSGERSQSSQAALAQQAKISPDQASAAALSAVPGTVQAVRLGREAGKVMYEVTVQPQGGGTPTNVEVDA